MFAAKAGARKVLGVSVLGGRPGLGLGTEGGPLGLRDWVEGSGGGGWHLGGSHPSLLPGPPDRVFQYL